MERWGLGTAQKRVIAKEIISSTASNFVILTETKLSIMNHYIIKSLWSFYEHRLGHS